jgi:hypothetical protein
MKEGMEELMKGKSDSGGGHISPRTIGINVRGTDFEIVSGSRRNEKSSVTVAQNEDHGANTTVQTGNEGLTNISPFLGNEIDTISLSSGSCSSTATFPSPPPSSYELAPSPFPHPIDKKPEVTGISHVGTHKHLHSSNCKPSTLESASHSLVTTPELTQLVEITSAAEKQPHSSDKPPKGTIAIKSARELPKGPLLEEKVCFFWYHKGYCRPRRGVLCPCLHTLDSDAKEVSLPDNLRFHRIDCELSLCPVRLRQERGKVVLADKEGHEVMRDVSRSIIPKINCAPQSQVKAVPKKHLKRLGRRALGQVRDQYAGQKAYLLQRYGTPPKGAGVTTIQLPKLPKLMADLPLIQNTGNPNLVPLSRKRKASVPETKSPALEAKRIRSSLFDVVEEPQCGSRVPTFIPDFLAKGTVHSESQVEVRTAQPDALVDYVLPSGEDRAEWDSDFLRRALARSNNRSPSLHCGR